MLTRVLNRNILTTLFLVTAPVLLHAQSPAVETWVLTPVDREHPLPVGFTPPGLQEFPIGREGILLPLNREAGLALLALFEEAAAEGYLLEASTGYRDRAFQKILHDGWVEKELTWGAPTREEAERRASRYSAPPGCSEHHLGTAVDINETGTPQFQAVEDDLYRFLTRRAHHFGFVLSYPPGRENDTGYRFEPWHLRWVGCEMAQKISDAGYLNGGITPNRYLLTLREKGETQ